MPWADIVRPVWGLKNGQSLPQKHYALPKKRVRMWIERLIYSFGTLPDARSRTIEKRISMTQTGRRILLTREYDCFFDSI